MQMMHTSILPVQGIHQAGSTGTACHARRRREEEEEEHAWAESKYFKSPSNKDGMITVIL